MSDEEHSADLDERRHASLELLKPLCISLMKSATKEQVHVLRQAITQIDDRIVQEIQQYILFPIQTSLRVKELSEGLLCELCEVVFTVFKKTEVASLGTFFDTFNPLMFILTPKDGTRKVVFNFDETKISLLKALAQLIKATQEVILCEIYCVQFVPALGQLVSVLLSFAEMEKSREIQMLALDCLSLVLQKETKFGRKYESQLADFFPFCLPGLTMATCRIATGDSKQGHKVIVKSMEVFTAVLTLVMGDNSLKTACRADKKEGKQDIGSSALSKQQTTQTAHTEKFQIKRSDEWVKATGSKVKILLERLCCLVSSDNWRIRLGLADVCEQLLATCSRSLSASLPKILETLVGLINDPYGNVARKAHGALQAFSTSAAAADTEGEGQAGERTLMDILEENLHKLATSLPRQIRMCDEDDKPALIRLLNGYISLMGPKISCVIDSSSHLSRLCLALVQTLELDTTDLRIVEERGTRLSADPETLASEKSTKVWKPRKLFKHFRDELIVTELLRACQQLGRYGNIHTLVEHLLDLCESSATYQLAATLVINEMVVGAAGQGEYVQGDADRLEDSVLVENLQLLPDVISMLVDEYLSPEQQRVIDRATDVDTSATSAATRCAPSLSSALVLVGADKSEELRQKTITRNRAIMLSCLHMEGLGKFAMVLGKTRQDHLQRTLYPLVENLGHENMHLSSTAYAALIEVAMATEHRALDSLLRENADYLVSSVSLRLRHLQQYRRTPQTLCVMLRFCTDKLLPLVRRSVLQLLDSLDEHYTEDLVLFMPVLLELVKAIARWFPSETHKRSSDESQSKLESSTASFDPEALVDFLTDYVKTKKAAEGDLDEDHGGGEMTLEDIEREMKAREEEREEEKSKEDQNDEEENKEKEVPEHIAVVKETFQRVRNLLSTNNGRLRVQALDVVTYGFQCMRGHERELLPQAHQMWAGLRPLFSCQEKFVVIKAMQTLLELSEMAGDFLRQRTMKEVMPGLASFMDRQAQISCGCHSGYLHTANYKLQLCLLSSLGILATNLQLDGHHLSQVGQICLPYLSAAQPQALQQASVESMSRLAYLEPDAVWLSLIQLHCPHSLVPPGPQFIPVKIPADAKKQNLYSSNIEELFRRHYSDDASILPD